MNLVQQYRSKYGNQLEGYSDEEIGKHLWENSEKVQKTFGSLDQFYALNGINATPQKNESNGGILDTVVDYAQGVGQGFGQAGSDILRGLEWLGSDTAGEWADSLDEKIKEYLPVDQSNEGFGMDLARGVGSFATFFIPGGVIAKVPGFAGKAAAAGRMGSYLAKADKAEKVAKVFSAAGLATSTALEASAEAGSVFHQVMEETQDRDAADDAATKTFFANAALIGVSNKMGGLFDAGKRASIGSRMVRSAPMEGGQEFGQSAISQYTASDAITGEGKVDWGQARYEGLLGMIIGGGAAGTIGHIENKVYDARELEARKRDAIFNKPSTIIQTAEAQTESVSDRLAVVSDGIAEQEKLLLSEGLTDDERKMVKANIAGLKNYHQSYTDYVARKIEEQKARQAEEKEAELKQKEVERQANLQQEFTQNYFDAPIVASGRDYSRTSKSFVDESDKQTLPDKPIVDQVDRELKKVKLPNVVTIDDLSGEFSAKDLTNPSFKRLRSIIDARRAADRNTESGIVDSKGKIVLETGSSKKVPIEQRKTEVPRDDSDKIITAGRYRSLRERLNMSKKEDSDPSQKQGLITPVSEANDIEPTQSTSDMTKEEKPASKPPITKENTEQDETPEDKDFKYTTQIVMESKEDFKNKLRDDFFRDGRAVHKHGNTTYVLTKSAKGDGGFQLTYLDDKGPAGDTAYKTFDSALNDMANQIPFTSTRKDLPDDVTFRTRDYKYVYEATRRPVGPGAVPQDGLLEMRYNDGETQSNGMVYGHVAYDKPLTRKQLKDFDLRPVGYEKKVDDSKKEVPSVKDESPKSKKFQLKRDSALTTDEEIMSRIDSIKKQRDDILSKKPPTDSLKFQKREEKIKRLTDRIDALEKRKNTTSSSETTTNKASSKPEPSKVSKDIEKLRKKKKEATESVPTNLKPASTEENKGDIEPEVDVKVKGNETTLSVDLPPSKEKNITPKEQKEYLLKEIDAAMKGKTKPHGNVTSKTKYVKGGKEFVEHDWNADEGPDSMPYYVFEVPGDGKFKIVQHGLKKFKQDVTLRFRASNRPTRKWGKQSATSVSSDKRIVEADYLNEYEPKKQALTKELFKSMDAPIDEGYGYVESQNAIVGKNTIVWGVPKKDGKGFGLASKDIGEAAAKFKERLESVKTDKAVGTYEVGHATEWREKWKFLEDFEGFVILEAENGRAKAVPITTVDYIKTLHGDKDIVFHLAEGNESAPVLVKDEQGNLLASIAPVVDIGYSLTDFHYDRLREVRREAGINNPNDISSLKVTLSEEEFVPFTGETETAQNEKKDTKKKKPKKKTKAVTENEKKIEETAKKIAEVLKKKYSTTGSQERVVNPKAPVQQTKLENVSIAKKALSGLKGAKFSALGNNSVIIDLPYGRHFVLNFENQMIHEVDGKSYLAFGSFLPNVKTIGPVGMISISKDVFEDGYFDPVGTMRHEIFHMAKRLFLTDMQIKILDRKFDKAFYWDKYLMDKENGNIRSDNLKTKSGLEEIQAEEYRQWDGSKDSAPSGIFNILKKSASRFVNTLLNRQNANDVIKAIENGLVFEQRIRQDVADILNNQLMGPSAKGAMLHRLQTAKQLKREGYTRDDIWRMTDWWEPFKDQWAFELHEDNFKWKKPFVNAIRRVGLDGIHEKKHKQSIMDIIDYPELFEAYPLLKTFTVYFKGTGKGNGGIRFRERKISATLAYDLGFGEVTKEVIDYKDFKDTLLHELQHAIQIIEGWEQGTTPKRAGTYAKYQATAGEVMARLVEYRSKLDSYAKRNIAPWVSLENMILSEGIIEDRNDIDNYIIKGNRRPKFRQEKQNVVSKIDKSEAKFQTSQFVADFGHIVGVEDPKKLTDKLYDALFENGKVSKEKIQDTIQSHRKDYVTQYVDKFNPQLDIYEALRETAIEAGIDPADLDIPQFYRMQRLATSMDSTLMALFHHGKIEWQDHAPIVKTKNKGIIPEIMEKLGADFRYWAMDRVADRAQHYMDKANASGTNPDEAKTLRDLGVVLGLDTEAKIRDIKSKTNPRRTSEWTEATKKFDEFQKNILDFAEEAGIIDPDARAEWEHASYIPFYRDAKDLLLDVSGPQFSQKKAIKNVIRKLKGSEAKLGDPVENILKNWTYLVSEAITNKVRFESIRGGIFTNSVVMLDNQGFGIVNGSKRQLKNKPTTLTYKVDGKTQYAYVHDQVLFNALSDIGPEMGSDGIMRMFRGAKRLLTAGATFSPAFRAANLLRDTLQAKIVHGQKFKMKHVLRGFMSAWKEDNYAIALQSAGGSFHAGIAQAESPKSMSDYLSKMVLEEKTKSGWRKIANPVTWMWETWQKVGTASENAVRIELYRQALERGDSHLDAAYMAKDNLDFTMHGQSKGIMYATQTIPFLNARLQGLYKLYREGKSNPKQMLMYGALLGLASLSLKAYNDDDEEYRNLPDYEKFTYYHFKVGDKWMRIPRPFEVGALFSTLPESLIDKSKGSFWKAIKHTMFETFAFNPIPQTGKPIFEVVTNHNFFTDRPIVGMDLERLPAGMQSKWWTPRTFKFLGEKFNVSPVQLEHALNGYLSTYGHLLTYVTDMALEWAKYGGEDPAWNINRYPLVGRFVTERLNSNPQFITELYDLHKEIDTVMAKVNYQLKSGNTQEAYGTMQENMDLISKKKVKNKLVEYIGQIREEMRQVAINDKLSGEEKRKRIDALVDKRNKTVHAYWDRYLKPKE